MQESFHKIVSAKVVNFLRAEGLKMSKLSCISASSKLCPLGGKGKVRYEPFR